MQQITPKAKNITEVEILSVLNISGKEMTYVRIWNKNHTNNVVISIGEKNFENLKNLLNEQH